MQISWRERLEQQPGLWEFNNWPTIPLDVVSKSRRKDFFRNQQIVVDALDLLPLHKIARKYNISKPRVSQLLERCLGGDAESPPALTKGLIPYGDVFIRQRKRQLPSMRHHSGNVCAFRALLQDVQGLREGLDAMIKAKLKDSPYAQRLTPQAFHGEFKRLLTEAHWPRDTYPYTTSSLAYQSVRRYLKERSAELDQEKQLRHHPPTRDLGIDNRTYRAQRATQIDEHTLDFKNRVHLELNDELIPLRLARACVLVAVDVDTTCVLGYYLAPTRHPNQQDLLTLFERCLTPWEPLKIDTKGLEYSPGACFPSGLENAYPISFGSIQLDNALMHSAQSIIDLACEKMGASLSFGPPGIPEIRYLVESVFDYIESNLGHRQAATTGSFPTDPKKESRKNLKKPPAITFQTVNEALSILLAEYNVTPKPSLGYASPLDLFEHHCATHFVRYIPKSLSLQWQPLVDSMEVQLHWRRNENRLPYVNFYYARYYGPGLLPVADKVKRIRVVFDRRDIRKLHGFSLDGEELGELIVSRSWQRFAHTIAIRQWIHRNTKTYKLNTRDPLSAYFYLLLENKGKPDAALSLLRVYTDYTYNQGGSLQLNNLDTQETGTKKANTQNKKYVWHPGFAHHRE